MDVLKEQRVCITFCQKLGKTATETYEMLRQAFGETALRRSKTFKWYSRFKNGHTSVNDDPHTGRLSTARTNKTVDRVNAVIRGNRCLTIREIADEISLSSGTCQAILMQDLGMRRVSAKHVLRHDNAPCHATLSVREFFAKHSIPVVPHLPYSPDLASCDFFLFPRLKSTRKGKRFQDVAEIQLILRSSCRPFPNKPTRHALKSGRVAAYNLEGRNLKEITFSNL
jgi:hypothetical protein